MDTNDLIEVAYKAAQEQDNPALQMLLIMLADRLTDLTA